jgi:D-alanyl-D-alanine dipeptidase
MMSLFLQITLLFHFEIALAEIASPAPPPAHNVNSPSCKAGMKPYPLPQDDMEDIGSIPNIVVDLQYNSNANFMGRDAYCGLGKDKNLNLKNAYLEKGCAKMLRTAAESMIGRFKLKVLDAFRPNPVQAAMRKWAETESRDLKIRKNPGKFIGSPYVAKLPKTKDPNNLDEPPQKVSMHLRGLAVDVTLIPEANVDNPSGVKSNGEVNMGTDFDDFTSCATMKPDKECEITPAQSAARQKLRDSMSKAGLTPYDNEWWHFECGDKNSLKSIGNHPVPEDPH